jgi:single-stranded DNA-binding protein
MGDTNIVGGIVKILEIPKQKIFHTNIPVTKFRVQFPQFRNTVVVHLTFWGNLARDIAEYYKTNDYILIEGYISVRNKHRYRKMNSKAKKVEITVLKVYPFLLSESGFTDVVEDSFK